MKSRIIGYIVQSFVIAALVAGTGFALRPLQQFVSARMAALKQQVVTDIERSTGRAISYSSISPSIFRYVNVRDLVIYGRAGERPVLLHINRLKIYYDIFAVLQGRMSDAVTSVSIENSRLSLNTSRDTDVVRFLQSVIAPGGNSAQGGIPRMTVQGKNLTLDFTSPDGTLEADNVFFTLMPGASQMVVRLRSNIDVTLTHPFLSVTHAESPVSVSATFRTVPSTQAGKNFPALDADASITVDHLATNSFKLSRQAFRLTYADGVISARKIEDRAPIDVAVQYDMKKRLVSAHIQTQDFVPSHYFSAQTSLAALQPWLSTSLTGKARLTASLGSGELQYEAELVADPDSRSLRSVNAIRADVYGDQNLLVARDIEIATQFGSARFQGDVALHSLLPSGTLTLSNVSAGGMAPLNASLSLARRGRELSITDPELYYGGETIYNLHAIFSPGQSAIGFAGGFAFDKGDKSSVSVNGSIPVFFVDGSTKVSAAAQEVPVEKLYRIVHASAPGLAAIGLALPRQLPEPSVIPKSLALSARLTVAEEGDKLQVDAPTIHLFDRSQTSNSLSLSLSADKRRIEVQRIAASYNGYAASGRIDAQFENRGNLAFHGSIAMKKVQYSFEGTYEAGRQITITESHGLSAKVFFSNLQQVAFQLSASDIPVVLGSRTSSVTIEASGIYSGPKEWEVNLNRFALSNVPFVPLAGTSMQLSGRISPGRGTLNTVSYTDGISSVEGNGTFSYNVPAGSGSQLNRLNAGLFFQLANQTAGESYRVDLSLNHGTLGGDALVRNLPLQRLGITSIQGGVDGELRLSGPLTQPVLGAQLSLNNATYNNLPVTAVVTGTLNSKALTIDSANIAYQRNDVLSAKGRLDFVEGTAGLSVTFTDTSRVPTPRKIDFTVSASYHPPRNPLDFGKIASGDIKAELSVSGLPLQRNYPSPWTFTVEKRGGNIQLNGGPENSLKGRIRADGDFVASAEAPLPFSFEADGRIKASKIEANINNLHFNLSLIKRVLDFQVFRLTQGDVTGSLRINGSTNDPDFYGTLHVTDGRANLVYSPKELGPSSTFLVFEEKHVTMTRFDVPVGDTKGQVQGTFTMNRWLPIAFTLQIDVPTSGGLKVDYTFGNVTVDGYTNGRIDIIGTPQETDVSGHLLAYSTSIALADVTAEYAPPITPSDAAPVKVNLTIESGKRVEFLYPSTTIPLLRGYAKLGQTIHIAASTNTGDFSLRGDVGIQGGEIFYFERSFYIRSGLIRFNETQNYFDPRLTVDAEIREVSDTSTYTGIASGANAGEVRISLVAKDEKLSQFTPRFVSYPAMTDPQIIALLSGNISGEFANGSVLGSAAFVASDLLTQFSVVRSFENAVRDALGLDLFSIRTQLFSNLLRGTILENQYPLDNTSPSLGKYLDNTTVFLGKYLGTDLFVEGLFRLQAQNPYVNADMARSFGGLVFDPEINLDWRTPFFDLQWNFAPQTPKTLFLSDNTVSLSWGYSY